MSFFIGLFFSAKKNVREATSRQRLTRLMYELLRYVLLIKRKQKVSCVSEPRCVIYSKVIDIYASN
jgi:hypothetical protein